MKSQNRISSSNFKEMFLEGISSSEDKLFMSKMVDQIQLSARYHEKRFSGFLDPRQQNLLYGRLTNLSDIAFDFWGGYDEAERRMVSFFPDYMESDTSQFPIAALQITGQGIEKLSHRDFLGAILGLGIKREKIGDIIVNHPICYCFCSDDIKEYILTSFAKVGSISISVSEKPVADICLPEKKYKIINSTVASLRLDAVISSGLGESRSKVLSYIQSEKVNVNWETVKSPSFNVKQGDVISVRGHGRMVLEQIGGVTRKGRISIMIKRYI